MEPWHFKFKRQSSFRFLVILLIKDGKELMYIVKIRKVKVNQKK